jgi:hypothetical protein
MSRYTPTAPLQIYFEGDRHISDLIRWASEEFQRVGAFADVAQDLEVLYAAPQHPREGMVRYFGEGGYNPGNGPGAYCYSNVYGVLKWRPMFPI